MTGQVIVNPAKTLTDYGYAKIVGLKRVAVQTWWHYKNKNVPTTRDGYMFVTIKVETPKAMLLSVQETVYTSSSMVDVWVPKSAVLQITEA